MEASNSSDSMYLVIGIVLILISCYLAYLYNRAKKILDELWAVDTYLIAELIRMVKGGFNAVVEIQGEISCPVPILAPASGVPCCWVNTTVAREERRVREVTERDSDGRTHTRTEVEYVWITDFDKTFATQFQVRDPSGYAIVDPTGGDIDAVLTRDEIVQHREPWFDDYVRFSDTGKYHIREIALLPAGYIFIHGEAVEHAEGVLLKMPEKGYLDPKARFFIISRRNEEQLTKSEASSRTLYFWSAILLFLAGAGFLLAYAGWL